MSRVWVPLLLWERPRHLLVPILAFFPSPDVFLERSCCDVQLWGLRVAIRHMG